MRTALIGHTGFIGSNLARQFAFDECYNSKNIGGIRGREFDLLISAGVSAVKWWANQNPAEDRARIDSLLTDLGQVRARRVVVLSTVDVYPINSGVDESFNCHSWPNHAYGVNRLHFEDAMRDRFGETTIVRIAGVFGPGLKKNVIYDLLHDNCLDMIHPDSSFQYYNVSRLWRDLRRLEGTRIRLINFVTEPIATRDIIDRFFPGKSVGAKPAPEAHYDVRTLHSLEFGASPPYLAGAGQVLADLGEFVNAT
ncbi:MAG: NAD(P)-dependent oxidoreductase [Bryobacteraceae bacterium]|jgi:nucleoside-diphosphate-sugar epimerase